MGLVDDLTTIRSLPPDTKWDAVDESIAWVYGHDISKDVLPIQSEFGLGGPGAQAQTAGLNAEQRLKGLRAWRAAVEPMVRGESIFTDNTTLYAPNVLSWDQTDGFVTAITLMDLDTLVRSIVLYERVLHLENDYVDDAQINRTLGHRVLVGVPCDTSKGEDLGSIEWALGDLWDECSSDLYWLGRRPRGSGPRCDGDALRRGWEQLLGRSFGWEAIDGSHPAARRRAQWSSWPPQNIGRMASVQRGRVEPFMGQEEALPFIDECNLRALFNTRVAGALGVAYGANISRSPLRYQQLKNARVAHDVFLDVAEIQRALRLRTQAAQRSWTLMLPVFLTVVLARMSKLDDFWSVVAHLRHQAAAYRMVRAELLLAIASGDKKAMARIEKAVNAEANAWRKALSVGVVAAVTIPLLSTGHGIASLIVATLRLLQAASAIDARAFESLRSRILKHDQWFLTRLGDTAESLTHALPRVQQLWRLDDEEADNCGNALLRMRAFDASWPDPAPSPQQPIPH